MQEGEEEKNEKKKKEIQILVGEEFFSVARPDFLACTMGRSC
jgi:hypothetical protein